MYKQIQSNKRRTLLLLVLFCAFVVGLLSFLAMYIGFEPVDAIIISTIFATAYSAISFYFSDKVTLSLQGAKPISKQ
ncbi:hypothetical protein KJ766_01000, partial [Patescibacteria group bacterium]|nr:hypothetical protein [Patescibacteria group bacterium]